MRETYAPTILERKARRLRKATGNPLLRSKLDSGLTPRDLFLFSIVRPTKMLIFSPIVLFLSLFVAITYSYLYLFFTTITEVFETRYGFRHDLVGLAFLGIGCGQFIGQFLYSYLANRSMAYYSAKGDIKPEQRLNTMLAGAILIPIGLLWYGWSVQANVQWIVPLLGTAIFSLGMLFIFVSIYYHPFYGNADLIFQDACKHVSRRRVPELRSLGHGSQHGFAFYSRSCSSSGRTENVCEARLRMGKLSPRTCLSIHDSHSVHTDQVWRADKKKCYSQVLRIKLIPGPFSSSEYHRAIVNAPCTSHNFRSNVNLFSIARPLERINNEAASTNQFLNRRMSATIMIRAATIGLANCRLWVDRWQPQFQPGL
jgi:hypothetical protein